MTWPAPAPFARSPSTPPHKRGRTNADRGESEMYLRRHPAQRAHAATCSQALCVLTDVCYASLGLAYEGKWVGTHHAAAERRCGHARRALFVPRRLFPPVNPTRGGKFGQIPPEHYLRRTRKKNEGRSEHSVLPRQTLPRYDGLRLAPHARRKGSECRRTSLPPLLRRSPAHLTHP